MRTFSLWRFAALAGIVLFFGISIAGAQSAGSINGSVLDPTGAVVPNATVQIRDTVSGFGGSVASCDNFIRMIGNTLADLQADLNKRNRAARNSFRRPH